MTNLQIELPSGFLSEEEKVLRVSTETKAIWAVELDLLQELMRVCRKHDIKFFGISGTLIGAARHKGFIPWDDDIDVVMLRSEYDKFAKIAQDEFRHPYFFQTDFNDPESVRGHPKIRNSETTAIDKSEMIGDKARYNFNQGAWLDIFILDNIPDDIKERAAFSSEMAKLKRRTRWIRHFRWCARNWRMLLFRRGIISAMIGMVVLCIEKLSRMDLLLHANMKLDRHAQRYNSCKCKWCAPVATSSAMLRHEVFKVSDFECSVELPFEILKIPVPANYEEVLCRSFGNWRKHVVGTSTHGGVLYDVERTYKKYLLSSGAGGR